MARIATKLIQFGCPEVRPAEGTREWEHVRGSFAKSPDLMAGPIVGNGAPQDFFIDVFSPKGEQFVNDRAGAPGAAAAFNKMYKRHGSFSIADLGREYEPFYGPINKKLAKYSATRGGSPMVGLAMYFCLAGDSFVGPILAHMHALAAVADAFGLTSKDNPRAAEMTKALNTMFVDGDSLAIVVHALKVPLAFLMIHADRFVDGNVNEKSLLIINGGVVHDEFVWRQNPVVHWLRALALGPLPPSQTAGTL